MLKMVSGEGSCEFIDLSNAAFTHSHFIAILFHCVVDIGVFKGIPPIDKLGQDKAIMPCVGLGETALRHSDYLNIPHYISTRVVSASDHPFSHHCHFAKVQPEHIASPAEG